MKNLNLSPLKLMKSKKENSIESELEKFCELHGIITHKMTGNRGTPDRVFFKDGSCMVMELKQPNGKVSKLQAIEMRKLQNESITAKSPFTLEEAKEILRRRFFLTGVNTHVMV